VVAKIDPEISVVAKKSMTADEKHRFDLVVQAIEEVLPFEKRGQWGSLLMKLFNESTSPSKDLLPHIGFGVYVTSLQKPEEQQRRRQLRLLRFFYKLSLPNIEKEVQDSGTIGVDNANKWELRKLKEKNSAAKQKLVSLFSERAAREALKEAQAESFKAIIRGRNLTFIGLNIDTMNDLFDKAKEAKAQGGGFLSAFGKSLGGDKTRATPETETVGDVLVNNASDGSKKATQLLGPLMTAAGLDMKQTINLMTAACPKEVAVILGKQCALSLPGVNAVVLGPSWASACNELRQKYAACTAFARSMEFMYLAEVHNELAFGKLKDFLATDLRGAKITFAAETLKSVLVTTDFAAPGTGTVAVAAVSAAKALWDFCELAYRLLQSYLQVVEGNRLLSMRFQDSAVIFEKVPILCCYYISLAPTSALIAAQLSVNHEYEQITSNPGAWAVKVNAQASRATELKKKANKFIENSFVALDGVVTPPQELAWWAKFKELFTGRKF